MKKIIYIILAITSVISCSKNEVMDYEASDTIYFYESIMEYNVEKRIDEKNYSFAVQDYDLMVDTMKIIVRLQGRVRDYDRIIKCTVVSDSSTAMSGSQYEILDGVLEAGEYMSYIPVVLYREGLNNQLVEIVLRISPNEYFNEGATEYDRYKLSWGDILMQPANWNYYLGDYSDNKYRFMIDVLGIIDFPIGYTEEDIAEGYFTMSEMAAMIVKYKEEYEKYREIYGPIYMDDNADPKIEIYWP